MVFDQFTKYPKIEGGTTAEKIHQWKIDNSIEDFELVFSRGLQPESKYNQMSFRFYVSKKDGGIYVARYSNLLYFNTNIDYFGPMALPHCRISLKANKNYKLINSVIILRTTKDNSGKITFTRMDRPEFVKAEKLPQDFQRMFLYPFEVQVLRNISSRYRKEYKKYKGNR